MRKLTFLWLEVLSFEQLAFAIGQQLSDFGRIAFILVLVETLPHYHGLVAEDVPEMEQHAILVPNQLNLPVVRCLF